jgi:hypothetical protein
MIFRISADRLVRASLRMRASGSIEPFRLGQDFVLNSIFIMKGKAFQ